MSQGFTSQHRGFHRFPSATFQAFEDNCVIKYSSWPAAGTTITNEGGAGADYNGTAADNDYSLLPSGATSFVFNNNTDQVSIPTGAATDNLMNFTAEYTIYYVASAVTQTLWYKAASLADYQIQLKTTGALLVWKPSAGVAGNDGWITTTSLLTPKTWNHIQITWAVPVAGPNGTAPIVKVNGVVCTVSNSAVGSGAWKSDAGNNLILGKYVPTTDFPFVGPIALFRLHNAVLTAAQLTQNYNADKWRIGI